ncbi:type II toxin-antitoxin system RelE/ParE family toxin [Luteolibacter sp. Populi]|uniref:type II toxin-antitoxin system RelE/ParE family toxin n=1 Tax=Luteolibacter sp. Populi TaxID=3230487 RepID=UPI003467D33D
MLRLRLHPEAEAEAFDAATCIKADDFQQGVLFVQALEDALVWARTQPLIFRCFDGKFRKARLGKFRYSLVFRLRDQEIQVIAVMHMSRKPGYWKNRRQSF